MIDFIQTNLYFLAAAGLLFLLTRPKAQVDTLGITSLATLLIGNLMAGQANFAQVIFQLLEYLGWFLSVTWVLNIWSQWTSTIVPKVFKGI